MNVLDTKNWKNCRFCFKAVKESQVQGDMTMKILDVLLQMGVPATKNEKICGDCLKIATKCLSIKSVWTNIERCILSFASYKDRVVFDIRDMYLWIKDRDAVIDEDVNICRLCINLFKKDYVTLDNVIYTTIDFMLPEVDWKIIENPTICTTCRSDLEYYFKFVMKAFKNADSEDSKPSIEMTEDDEVSNESSLPEKIVTQTVSSVNKENSVEKRYKCSLCTFTTSWKKNLKRHLVGVHVKNVTQAGSNVNENKLVKKTYKCSSCTLETNWKRSLKRHLFKVHKKVLPEKDVIQAEKKYKCPSCTFSSDWKENIKKHSFRVHKKASETPMHNVKYSSYETPATSLIVTQVGSNVNENNLVEKKHKCTLCTFATNWKGNLNKHLLKIHKISLKVASQKKISEVVVFECFTCKFKTKYKASLVKHMSAHMNTPEGHVYKCSECPYETPVRYRLYNHNMIHKQVEIFECFSCGFKTKSKRNLRNHILVHENMSKTYKCASCPFQTLYKSSMQYHQLRHKDIADVEMHQCPSCPLKAKGKRQLKLHMLCHKDLPMFQCSHCDYKNKDKRRVRKHELIHTDPSMKNAFECFTCGYKTWYKESLKYHMLLHRAIVVGKKHKCPMCPFKTRLRSTLRSHYKMHWKDTE